MHILITGGTGFIGRNLIKHLTEHQLTILSRSKKRAKKRLQHADFAKINYIETLDNLTDLNHIDAIINLAGEPIADKRWSEKQKKIICQSRWEITKQLTQLIQQSSQPPHTFISGSAVGFYGDQGLQSVDESTPVTQQGFAHQICATWEKLALDAQSAQTRVCILRTGVVLGAGSGIIKKILPPFKMGLGGRLGNGKQYMPWIHIQDMVLGICHLLKTPSTQGTFNFCAPHPVTNQVFTQTFAHILNRPAVLPVPSVALKLLMGESSCLVLDSVKAKPKQLTATGFDFIFPHLTPALRQVMRYHQQMPQS